MVLDYLFISTDYCGHLPAGCRRRQWEGVCPGRLCPSDGPDTPLYSTGSGETGKVSCPGSWPWTNQQEATTWPFCVQAVGHAGLCGRVQGSDWHSSGKVTRLRCWSIIPFSPSLGSSPQYHKPTPYWWHSYLIILRQVLVYRKLQKIYWSLQEKNRKFTEVCKRRQLSEALPG